MKLLPQDHCFFNYACPVCKRMVRMRTDRTYYYRFKLADGSEGLDMRFRCHYCKTRICLPCYYSPYDPDEDKKLE